METVFHDVPFTAGFKSWDKAKLNGQVHSQILPAADLVLADLGSKAMVLFGDRVTPGLLRQMGASRSLTGNLACYGELLDLAAHIGVDIVPGRA